MNTRLIYSWNIIHTGKDKYSINTHFNITKFWKLKGYTRVQLQNRNISKKYVIHEFTKGIFPIKFKIIYYYKWKHSGLRAKKNAQNTKRFFHGGGTWTKGWTWYLDINSWFRNCFFPHFWKPYNLTDGLDQHVHGSHGSAMKSHMFYSHDTR